MKLKWFDTEVESFIIVRTCVGCILPSNSKLIGDGTYIRLLNGIKTEEPYYDYEIKEKFFMEFMQQNRNQLLDYNLIEEPKKKQKPINTVEETTLRGYAKELKNKQQ